MGVKKYTTKDGNAFYRVDTWVDGQGGVLRRVRKSRIPTREQALAFEAKVKIEAFEGRWFDRPKQITVARVWEVYEPITKAENRSGRADVGRAEHLVEHLGTVKVEAITQRHIDEYREKRFSEESRRGSPPSVATVNREVGLLKRMLNRAARRGDIRANPVAHVRLLREDNVRQRAVSEAEFSRLLASAEAWFRPILVVAYDTGMRRREVLDLRWDQVDLKEGAVRLAPSDTKSGKARLVLLTDRVRAALADLPRPLRGGWVFSNPSTGRPYHDIKKAWQRACAGASLEGVWFHDLRRSFVTNARRRGVEESVVMRMSGHQSRSVFERYNVVSDGDLRSAVERIEAGRRQELAAAAGEKQK